MNCPYCQKRINAFTGFQEADKFQRHLMACKKKPQPVTLLRALEIRAESGQ